MPILNIIITLIVIGVLLYLVNLIPMDGTIKQVINLLVLLIVILWIIQLFFPGLAGIRIGRY